MTDSEWIAILRQCPRQWQGCADSGHPQAEPEPTTPAIAITRKRYAGPPDRQRVVARADDGMICSESRSRTRSANERNAREHVSRSRAAHSRFATATR